MKKLFLSAMLTVMACCGQDLMAQNLNMTNNSLCDVEVVVYAMNPSGCGLVATMNPIFLAGNGGSVSYNAAALTNPALWVGGVTPTSPFELEYADVSMPASCTPGTPITSTCSMDFTQVGSMAGCVPHPYNSCFIVTNGACASCPTNTQVDVDFVSSGTSSPVNLDININ